MRRWLPVVVLALCATPAVAQTRWIVGNTLIDVPSGLVLADARSGHGKGHGHGRGGGAPAPSPAPAVSAPTPAPQSAGEMGRGETSFQYHPGGSVVIPPVAQFQTTAPPAPSTQAQPQTPLYTPPASGRSGDAAQPYEAPGGCEACPLTTVTLPVHLQVQVQVKTAPAPAPYVAPTAPAPPVYCPAGCVPAPGGHSRLCNAAGACIPWP